MPKGVAVPRTNRSYLVDSDIDRAALAERNARVLLERGEEPSFVAQLIPDADVFGILAERPERAVL